MFERFLESVLLRLCRFGLVPSFPFLIRHAVDMAARIFPGQRDTLFIRRVLQPVPEAIPAETRQIHQIDVLRVRALAEMGDQAAESRRFQFRAGLGVEVFKSHDRHPWLAAPTVSQTIPIEKSHVAAAPCSTPRVGQAKSGYMTQPPDLPKPLALPFLGLVAGAIFMGCSPIFVRLADVGPFSSAFWRVALALPPLWLWQKLAREPASTDSRGFSRSILFAGAAFAGDLIFWHLSILNTTIANATLLSTMAPVWVFLVSFLFFQQVLRRAEIVGLAICIVGGMLLIRDSFEIDRARLTGDLQAVATSLFFGLYIVGIDQARRFGGPARIMFLSTAFSTVLLLVAAIIAGERFWPATVAGWLPLLGLAFISQAAGQGLLAFALGRLPVAFSSLVVFLEALAAAALGWLVLSERLGLWQWLGGCLVLLGIWLARPAGNRGQIDARQ